MTETRLITEEKLKKIAKNLLTSLNEEGINTMGDLHSKVRQFFYAGEREHKIYIDSTVVGLNDEISTYIITYLALPKGGVPIEIIINPSSKESEINLRVDTKIKGYSPTTFGQTKKIASSVLAIKKELEARVA
ncbi:MAG TPA: hypothetical protein VMV95_03320 [Bacillota bacterium]|nr:hypothetical protein [Bacillota bacterium]